MYGTQRNTGYGYSLFEFEVYGVAPSTASNGDFLQTSLEKENQSHEVSIYPIPVKDLLNISLPDNSYSYLEIVDITGIVCLKRDISELTDIQLYFKSFPKVLISLRYRGKMATLPEGLLNKGLARLVFRIFGIVLFIRKAV